MEGSGSPRSTKPSVKICELKPFMKRVNLDSIVVLEKGTIVELFCHLLHIGCRSAFGNGRWSFGIEDIGGGWKRLDISLPMGWLHFRHLSWWYSAIEIRVINYIFLLAITNAIRHQVLCTLQRPVDRLCWTTWFSQTSWPVRIHEILASTNKKNWTFFYCVYIVFLQNLRRLRICLLSRGRKTLLQKRLCLLIRKILLLQRGNY